MLHGTILRKVQPLNKRLLIFGVKKLCRRYINELIEYVFLASKDNGNGEVGVSTSNAASSVHDPFQSGVSESKIVASSNQSSDLTVAKSGGKTSVDSHLNLPDEDCDYNVQHQPADWALILEAATKRRTQVLAPENLENMWTKGRNYKKKSAKAETFLVTAQTAGVTSSTDHAGHLGKEMEINKNESTRSTGKNFLA